MPIIIAIKGVVIKEQFHPIITPPVTVAYTIFYHLNLFLLKAADKINVEIVLVHNAKTVFMADKNLKPPTCKAPFTDGK